MEEVIQHFSKHGASPNDRGIVFNKESHRNHFDPESFNRHDLFSFDRRPYSDSHHIRNTETVNIGVD